MAIKYKLRKETIYFHGAQEFVVNFAPLKLLRGQKNN